MCYGVCKSKIFLMTTEQTRIHSIIGLLSLLITFFLSLVFVVSLKNKAGIIWNIFPYISSIPVILWVVIIGITVLVTPLFIYPVCEMLGGGILRVYCFFNKNSDLYDNFKLPVNTDRPRYKGSSSLFSGPNPKYWKDEDN